MWIIYWVLMVFNGEPLQISGTIVITDSTAVTYLYPYQYIEWQITNKKERVHDDKLERGEYFLERNQITSYLVITQTEIYQYIAITPPIHIRAKRKWQKQPTTSR